MAEVRSIIRALIRSINATATKVNGNPLWKEHALQTFRANRSETDPAIIKQHLQLAKDYTFLIRSLKEHQELLLSYNIGIDVDSREKHMNKRAANLVGLQMPTVPEE